MISKRSKDIFFIPYTEFTRNVATLTYGIAIAQFIAILLQPLLRRLYSPADFGAFAIFLSLVEILVSVGTLRYEMGIVIAKHDKHSINLLGTAAGISVIVNLVVFILLLFLVNPVSRMLGFPSGYRYWLYLVPLVTLLYNLSDTANFWLIRKKEFRASSLNKISRRAAEGIVQAASGFAHFTPGLVIGTLFGHIANLGAMLFQLPSTGFRAGSISLVKMKYVLKKYREFPLYATLPATLNIFSLLLPVFIVNRFFTQADTGYFDLSRQILIVPMALIAASISQVLFQKLSEKKNNHEPVSHIVWRIFMALSAVSVIGVTVLWFWGEPLFVFIFGSEWRTSGAITGVLSFGFAMKFIVSSGTATLISLGRIKWLSAWQVFYFLAIVSLFFIKYDSFYNFCTFYAIFDVISSFVLFAVVVIAMRRYENEL